MKIYIIIKIKKNINPSDLFKNEFNRPLLNSEKTILENGYRDILGSMIKRNASKEEINKIEEFKDKSLNKEVCNTWNFKINNKELEGKFGRL